MPLSNVTSTCMYMEIEMLQLSFILYSDAVQLYHVYM